MNSFVEINSKITPRVTFDPIFVMRHEAMKVGGWNVIPVQATDQVGSVSTVSIPQHVSKQTMSPM
jgi:hypothetical protein